MSSALAATIAGLRACRVTSMPVSPALRDAALEILISIVSRQWRRSERNRLIRAAARLLPEGNLEARTKALLRESRAMLRMWRILEHQPPHTSEPTVRALLHEARLIEELPDSLRQFRRILEEATSDIGGVAMSATRPEDTFIHNQEERCSEY